MKVYSTSIIRSTDTILSVEKRNPLKCLNTDTIRKGFQKKQ